jgi:GNAT superfamily N-acetyltransferase
MLLLDLLPLAPNSMTIRTANPGDSEAIAPVINDAFRVAESFFITRDRISPEKVRALIGKGKFLLLEDADGVAGCVYVELRGDRAYFGLLAVDLSRQKRGYGKRLIAAAEDYARERGCRFMDIRIVNLRQELPAFYRALGYVETGTEPFAADESAKLPCHFIVMTKALDLSARASD